MIRKMRSSGVIVVPWQIRERLGWGQGSVLHVELADEETVAVWEATPAEADAWKQECLEGMEAETQT